MSIEQVQFVVLAGSIGLIARGCYLVWPPLACLVPGALMIVGVVASRMSDIKPNKGQ